MHFLTDVIIKYNRRSLIKSMQKSQATTLPTNPQERMALVNEIQKRIAKLEHEIKENIDDKKLITKQSKEIETLKLRIKLIMKCGELSLLRLSHLQEVFKHYCTHVFRTGRYMTFERLQYEKLHMTMQRFFIFLKDFELITATIDGKPREVIEKSAIITIFKKTSANARELSFEEFIQCIEKLAILFWDEKQGYNRKQQLLLLEKEKRKRLLEKRKRKKEGVKSENSVQKDKNNGETKKEEEIENEANVVEEKNVNHENDNLIEELLNNQNIEDPNEEVRYIAERAKKENAVINEASKAIKERQQSLLRFTNDQKIESYYQLLDIDSLDSYKQKLSGLNLPIFTLDYTHQNNKQHTKALSESKLQVAQLQEQQRLQKLKAKMNEKKEKLKERPLPKPSNEKALKQQQNARRRRQMKKQRQMAVKQVKQQEKKKQVVKEKIAAPKIEYKDGQVNWQMLQRLNIDHLKLKQFNPAKFMSHSEDDHYFLEEYGAKPRISSRLQARQRQSLSIVESTKMRAEEIERKEKQKQRGAETAKRASKQVTSFSRNKI